MRPETSRPKVNLQIEKESITLRGRVEEKLRLAIVSGYFVPGQRLVERELCELIGVGRTSVREAMRQLEAEGLIRSVPHRGPIVQGITPEEAVQLYALRVLLEGYAARCCAERADDEAKQILSNAAAAFVHAAERESHESMMAAKDAVYDSLLDGARNPFVKQTLTAMQYRISMLRFGSFTTPGRLEESVNEIKQIVEAIRTGDGDKAEAVCRRHIERAAALALAALKNES
ncbi:MULTISPECIES: GntR family transcriptional regulator [Mameliella]|uniref:GntR family transcriptional regulator n=1 Tax=Mameliella TaxID=1434019 RepID=UPI000B52BB0A|nr:MULTISPECIES: GntR family transcriptional regulator [Mameliella]OWV55453.1 GntR family transcriptional regulator [Mameliella alba]